MIDPKEFFDLNPLLQDKARLLIMCTLSAAEAPVDFSTLCRSLELTKGNLSTHIRKLEEAGFVKVKKEFVGRKPRTTYSCSSAGRREIARYLEQVEKLLRLVK